MVAVTDGEPHLEIEVEKDGETHTLTVPSGADVTLNAAASEDDSEDTDSEDPVNVFHKLGSFMVLPALASAVTAPFTSVGFREQAAFAFALFILAMGAYAIGEISEYGEVPDPREQEYSVPDDPMDLLSDDGGDGDE